MGYKGFKEGGCPLSMKLKSITYYATLNLIEKDNKNKFKLKKYKWSFTIKPKS